MYPHPLPYGLTYFYKEFDSEYCPNPGDIDIFFQQPILALKFNLSDYILYFLARILKVSTCSVGLIVTCIRWHPFKTVDSDANSTSAATVFEEETFMLVTSICYPVVKPIIDG